MDFNYEGYSIVTAKNGNKVKTRCPKCSDARSDKRDKSLFINTDDGVFCCFYCGWKGKAHRPGEEKWKKADHPAVHQFARPVFDTNKTMLSEESVRWLVEQRGISQEVIKRMQICEEVRFFQKSGKKEKCICFPYFLDDELVNMKYRALSVKDFMLMPNARLVPWNIDGVIETEDVLLTEGEMDGLSCMMAGFRNVISVPNGANGNMEWLDPFVESHFENKKVIYIAVDMDKQGLVLRNELLRRFGRERCRVVTYGEGCKDANEHLLKYGAESLKIYIDKAPELPLDGVFTVEDVIDNFRSIFEKGIGEGLTTGFPNLDRCMRLETGMLAILTGIPGSGKSEFVDMLVAKMYMEHNWKTAFFSPENMPCELHYVKHAEKMTGKKFKVGVTSEEEYQEVRMYLKDNIHSIIPKEEFTIQSILAKARELIRRKGIKALVLDPFNCIDHQYAKGITETQYISKFLDKLRMFAVKNDILIILVAHPKKMEPDPKSGKTQVPNMYSINGSAHFFNKTDYGLTVERDDKDNLCTIHVQKVRFRNLGSCGEAHFVFNYTNGRFTPCEVTKEKGDERKVTFTTFDNSNWLQKKLYLKDAAAKQQVMDFSQIDPSDPKGNPDLPF